MSENNIKLYIIKERGSAPRAKLQKLLRNIMKN